MNGPLLQRLSLVLKEVLEVQELPGDPGVGAAPIEVGPGVDDYIGEIRKNQGHHTYFSLPLSPRFLF
jgi:hypothetical protein